MSKEELGKSLKIILELLNDTNAENRVTKAKIGRTLEDNDIKCHRGTVESRLNLLRDMGYNIEEVPRKGVYLEQEENDLTNGQLRILIDSIISSGLLNQKNLKLTVESLANLGSKEFAKHMKKYAYSTSQITSGKNQSIVMNVEDIQKAIFENKQISCNYIVYDQNFNKQKKYAENIIIDPYEMAFSNGKYYLLCAFDGIEDITVLRVDRLVNVKVLESQCRETQEITRLKNNHELYKYIYNQPLLKGGKTEQFKVLCYRDSLDEVFDAFDGNMRKWNLDNTNYDDPDTIGVTVETTREAMKAWAIIHAENAVVIHPDDLKEEIINIIDKSKHTYNKSGKISAIRAYGAMSFDDALYELRNRGYQYIHYYRNCKKKIDLGQYPQLLETKTLVLKNNDISSTIFHEPLTELTSLTLCNVIFNAEMFKMLPSLKGLTIYNSELTDISFIKHCKELTNIRLICCNITDFTPLLELNNLRSIETNGELLDNATRNSLKAKFPNCILYLREKNILINNEGVEFMALRPAYSISNDKVIHKNYEFQWFAGFSPTQKQKSITSLHDAIIKADSNAKPLEISTKSTVELGEKLSAFNLRLNGHTLENIFQSSKVFQNGGPYRDILDVHPKKAKMDERLRTSGELTGFNYNGNDFPLEPKTVFYDYIYINAVKETLTDDEIQQIKDYTCFTDIEFNPNKSINTQAKSVAIIKLMLEMYGNIPELDINDFIVFHKQFVNA